MMTVAVYCSAKDAIPDEYLALGKELGTWLGEHAYRLVYGGATGGLMSRVSNAAKEAGGYVIGVIPERIIHSGRKAGNCDEFYEVGNLCDRKHLMREIADCFVCLPGSFGTLDEMFDVISSGTIGEHKKPTLVLDYKGFYTGLRAEIAHMKELHFLPQQEQYSPIFVETMAELFASLQEIRTAHERKIQLASQQP